MTKKHKDEIRQAIIKILKEYNITSVESLEAMDEELGCELYENLKAGVLEEFDLKEAVMEKIFNEVVQSL